MLPIGSAAVLEEQPRITTALERVGLADCVAGVERWQRLDALVAIPWNRPEVR